MIADSPIDLSGFADWIRATDDHADHHLSVLAQAEQALSRPPSSSAASDLADKIERWRYQHLHQHRDGWGQVDQALVEALDLTANRLAGRPERPPRRTRWAVEDDSQHGQAVWEALAVLDPAYPLDRLVWRASELTAAAFSRPIRGQPGSAARRRMLLYAPLYLSSHCVNFCTYCGFRYPLDIARRQLSAEQAAEQVRVLRSRGFGHVLLVGGDFPQLTTTGYYADVAAAVVREGLVPAIEIAPQSTRSYAALAATGVCGVTLYQETYDQRLYREYHVRGPKSHFDWRLEALDRAAEGGMRRLGLGVLLGLADPLQDVSAMIRHGSYLAERFPDRTLAFSLPRIHEAPAGFEIPCPIRDDLLVRLYCALRIAFPGAELVLSTRERPELRNQLAAICITQMSAGSSTAPGGYSDEPPSLGEQFPISDHRTPAEVAGWLEDSGIQVAWELEQVPAARVPGPLAMPAD